MIHECKGCGGKGHMQDKIHGKGKRVFNMTKPADKGGSQSFRCTVCETVITVAVK